MIAEGLYVPETSGVLTLSDVSTLYRGVMSALQPPVVIPSQTEESVAFGISQPACLPPHVQGGGTASG